ncbi:MAG TPA: hypothetical protein VF094_09795 [Gaiellaceae bacterium]
MKASTISVLVASAALAGAVAPAGFGRPAGGGPPCVPKVTKIGGKTAAVNCGPSTATLHIGGKTYTFHAGFCDLSSSGLQLTLGTVIPQARKTNAGKPSFSMLVAWPTKKPSGSLFSAYTGGRQILGDSLVTVTGGYPSNGQFKSTFTVGQTFTGSWNCHGALWKH